MIVSTIRTVLLSVPSLSADVSTRIYPIELPEGSTLPAILLQEISHKQEYSLDHFSRVQVSIITETSSTEYGYDIAHRIRDIVRASLLGYQGYCIESIEHVGDTEMKDDEGRFLIHSDYYIIWS